jgi:four helix bundle protein
VITDLKLWQKCEDFIDYFYPIVDRFPKSEKFALCSQIKNVCYEIMHIIVETNKSQSKKSGWFKADVKLEILRWFVRHSHKRGYLSGKSLEVAAKRLDEIGRIIGGLIKGI